MLVLYTKDKCVYCHFLKEKLDDWELEYETVHNEPLPKGTYGKEADELAEKMMSSIDKKAFDNTEILKWSFRGKHHYVWKKQHGKPCECFNSSRTMGCD